MDRRRVKSTGFFETREQLEAHIIKMNKEGFSNREIAQAVGVSKETVHGIIRGRYDLTPEDRERQEGERARALLRECGW